MRPRDEPPAGTHATPIFCAYSHQSGNEDWNALRYVGRPVGLVGSHFSAVDDIKIERRLPLPIYILPLGVAMMRHAVGKRSDLRQRPSFS